MRQLQSLITLGCMLLVVQLLGCGSKAVSINYYSLEASTPQIDKKIDQPLPLSIGVGPVQIPQLLKRPHLVTRSATYQVEHAAFDRWSGDLQEEITHALARSISRQLGTKKISIYPWGKTLSPDWKIRVDIQRLDGERGKAAYLEARWTLIDKKGVIVLTELSQHHEKIEENSYEALVAAQSRLLEIFSLEISDKIRSRH